MAPMQIVSDENAYYLEHEMFPRWFDFDACIEDCSLCSPEYESKKGFDRGTFGIVRYEDNIARKLIPDNEGVVCSSAIREVTTFFRMGTTCPQLVQCIQPVVFDGEGNTVVTMERADTSLLNFTRCKKLRHIIQGFERMSSHFVLWSLLKGVTHLNSCHLMHRDIKPGNVLVFPGPRVALCDFGGCRMTLANIDFTDIQMSGSVCTKHYAPPEEPSGKHNIVFDCFSIVATVIHYTMSGAPMYQPMNKVNRQTFQKLCKPYPNLLMILRLLCNRNPERRMSAMEALSLFEKIFPYMARKFNTYHIHTGNVPARVSVHGKCTWEKFHHFSSNIWPGIVECVRVCQQRFWVDGTSSITVMFYVINMLQNLHNSDKASCNQERCYVMHIPTFVRAAILLTGSATLLDNFLEPCHAILKRHQCTSNPKKLKNVNLEAMAACRILPSIAMDWVFPSHISSIMELQEELNL